MTFQQQKFHEVFKNLGGIFDINTLEEEEFNYFNNIRSETYKLVETLKIKYPNLPVINIDFIVNNALNAIVTKKDNEYYLGINMGSYFLLYDMYRKMLCTKGVLSRIGDDINEDYEKKIISSYWDGIIMFDSERFNETKILPKDHIRAGYVQYFTNLALAFLIHHECGHIIRGHVDYAKSLMKNFWIEFESIDSKKNIKSLDRQTMEMDADSFATNWAFILANKILKQQNLDLNNKEAYADWPTFASNWVFAVYSLFRLFGFNDIIVQEAKEKTHPPAIMRISIIADNIVTLFMKIYDPKLKDPVAKAIIQAIADAEKAFQSITFHDDAFGKYVEIYFKEDLKQYKIDIKNNWNNVRPLIERYAFGVLPNYHHS